MRLEGPQSQCDDLEKIKKKKPLASASNQIIIGWSVIDFVRLCMCEVKCNVRILIYDDMERTINKLG